ncbi:hypothetical protein [Marinomonas communis]|uniref:hypothetical protein n=1 Tax=Marinomonas communis TaxID=28254 RepID=UPI001D1980F3|nr:hypothetical protein [Marinomonas communis]MCC4272880.1 hypothetical protein [Marinomonas communis]
MKAIKLASVFAVSAVAAAVSTSTFAAEPVFSGTAGIEYTSYYGDSKTKGDLADGTDIGELELSVDTGVVYAEIEVATNGKDEGTTIGFEKLYVKQGAVSFGRFDGSVAAGAFMGMDEIGSTGIDLNVGKVNDTTNATTYRQGDTDNTGVRYKVAPGLTVALEATSNASSEDSEIGVALSYIADLDGIKLGISGGAIDDANAVNVGAQFDAGPATISVNYGTGETGTGTTTDVEEAGFSVEFAATEALTLTLQYNKNLEAASGADDDGTYFIASYAAGDLTYYFENYNGVFDDEMNIVGVKASF